MVVSDIYDHSARLHSYELIAAAHAENSSVPMMGAVAYGVSLKPRLVLNRQQAREACETAPKIEDVDEQRRQAAYTVRAMRYFAARVRTAQVITDPAYEQTRLRLWEYGETFRRGDGRVQKYPVVGEDEADPKAGTISFVSPVAKSLMGKAVGGVIGASAQELEIISIS